MDVFWCIVAFGLIMWPVQRLRDQQHRELQEQIAELRKQLLRAEERLVSASYSSANSAAKEIIRVMP